MEYFLKSASPQDLETIIPWLPSPEALRLWAGPALTFPPCVETTWQEIGATEENSHSLIDSTGAIIGFGQTLLRDRGKVHLARIIVSPAVRGRGVGYILCQELIRVGVEHHHASTVTLNVYKENTTAVKLYTSLGFTVLSEDPENNWFGMRLQLHPESTIKG